MALKSYALRIGNETLTIRHNDSQGDDGAFQPYPVTNGESLTLEWKGQKIPYGTDAYFRLITELKLPDLDHLHLPTWTASVDFKSPSPHPLLPRGEYRLDDLFRSHLTVGAERCLVRWTNSAGTIRGVTDDGCDGRPERELSGRPISHGDEPLHYSNILTALTGPQTDLQQTLARIREIRAEIDRRAARAREGTGAVDLFFETDSNRLSREGRNALDKAIEANPNATDWLIEGYCDHRGSIEHNFELGRRRAEAVAQYLRNKLSERGRDRVVINTVSYGESRAAGETPPEMKKDRRATVIPALDPLTRALALTDQTDAAYLIDASSSMSPFQETILYYPYPERAAFWVFSGGCGEKLRPLETIYDFKICGDTPLWESVLELVGRLPEGRPLIVLTDGEASPNISTSEGPKDEPSAVIAAATAKRVPISMINLSGVENSLYTRDLIRVARETGGSHYIVHRVR